ncbi:4-amino-4-deoxy-L-arabinose transferase [Catalinimonas alkaloidigena]|uniref:4-amino-4-deoxy-L-arabinose transferase n=1 Tax=Catalinimonas alkaloidigena TaxID=1075417 RepID=A0A1G9HD87_9BACT|nr:glycosyltransferase family 39 protein [Catalinimonas alkaloidigena]SDL10869.1 4-amino-4-deoxy-L-arabinose transferase [Catalinimonas alkaloidigena]
MQTSTHLGLRASVAWRYVLLFHVVLALFKLYVLVLEPIDLYVEEAQYWLWSKHLAWSYYSKPPLIAYLNFLTTQVFGDTVFAIRLNAVLVGLGLVVLVYRLTYELFKDELTAVLASFLVYAFPFYHFVSTLFLTDSPLALCWLFTLYYFWRAVQHNRLRDWCLVGLGAGLGFLAKYVMVLFFPIALIWLWVYRRERLGQKGFWLAVGITVVCMVPVLVWMAQHQFVAARHVTHLAGADAATPTVWKGLVRFVSYTGGQAALVSVFLLPTFYLGLKRLARRSLKPEVAFLWSFPAGVFLFFGGMSVWREAYPNWPVFAYATLPILLAYLATTLGRLRQTCRAVMLSVGVLMLVFIPVTRTTLVRWVDPTAEPLGEMMGWRELAETVEAERQQLGEVPHFVFSDSYQIASELAFYLPGHPQTYCINSGGRRMNQFDLWPGLEQFAYQGYRGIYISNVPLAPETEQAFGLTRHIKHVLLYTGNALRKEFYIYILEDFENMEPQTPQSF